MIQLPKNIIKYYPPENPFYFRVGEKLGRRYSKASPFELIHVHPARITHCSGRPFSKWGHAGEVKEGSWDLNVVSFEDATFYDGIASPIYPSLVARFSEGIRWNETEFIDEVKTSVSSGKKVWGCSSLQEVKKKCEWIDGLYRSIRLNGYLSQEDQLNSRVHAKSPVHALLKKYTILGKDEIAVDIGRDGQLLFYDGKHRLSLSKIIGVEQIPVRVVVRHKQWERKRRNSDLGDGLSQELASHPDFRRSEEAR